jgi:hypothetical protein
MRMAVWKVQFGHPTDGDYTHEFIVGAPKGELAMDKAAKVLGLASSATRPHPFPEYYVCGLELIVRIDG